MTEPRVEAGDRALETARKFTDEVFTEHNPTLVAQYTERLAALIQSAMNAVAQDRLERYKNLCLYCRKGYKSQKFPKGNWGHDDVPETREFGSWPHDCKAGDALEAELKLASSKD